MRSAGCVIDTTYPLVASRGPTEVNVTMPTRTLGLAPRTMQRRLTMLGLSFESLLECRRREIALRYLTDLSLRITDVAMLLGYSDAANFIRAFQRWFRQSPASYRFSLAQDQFSSGVGVI
jgi:AraC-like DNA-binding protein